MTIDTETFETLVPDAALRARARETSALRLADACELIYQRLRLATKASPDRRREIIYDAGGDLARLAVLVDAHAIYLHIGA